MLKFTKRHNALSDRLCGRWYVTGNYFRMAGKWTLDESYLHRTNMDIMEFLDERRLMLCNTSVAPHHITGYRYLPAAELLYIECPDDYAPQDRELYRVCRRGKRMTLTLLEIPREHSIDRVKPGSGEYREIRRIRLIRRRKGRYYDRILVKPRYGSSMLPVFNVVNVEENELSLSSLSDPVILNRLNRALAPEFNFVATESRLLECGGKKLPRKNSLNWHVKIWSAVCRFLRNSSRDCKKE